MAGIFVDYEGTRYEFPEGTTDDKIERYFEKKRQQPQSAAPAQQEANPQEQVAQPTSPSYWEEYARGLRSQGARTLGAISETVADTPSLPGLPFSQLISPFGDDIQDSYRGTAERFRGYAEAQPSPTVQDFREGFSSFDNFARYLLGGLGASTPETALGLTGGVTGGTAAATTALSRGATPLTQTAAGLLGSYFGSSAATFPSFYGENLEAQRAAGVPEEELDRADAFYAAASQAQLGAIFDTILAGRISRIAAPSTMPKDRVKAVLAAPLLGAVTEVPTEVAQEALQLYQANPDLLLEFSPEVQEHLLQTAVGAGVIGAAMSTATEAGSQIAEGLMARAREKRAARVLNVNRELDTDNPVTPPSDAITDQIYNSFDDAFTAATGSPPQGATEGSRLVLADGSVVGFGEDGRAAKLTDPALPLSDQTVFVPPEDAKRLTDAGGTLFFKDGKVYPAKENPETGRLGIPREFVDNPVYTSTSPAEGMAALNSYNQEGARTDQWEVTPPVSTILPNAMHTIRTTESEAFNNWFGDSKAVDTEGKPLVLYRGVRGDTVEGIPDAALAGSPREGYATFASNSPSLASSYSVASREADWGVTGAVVPFYVKADEIIEFPVKETSYPDGTVIKSFDKFEFDKQAKRLKPGQVLAVRGITDIGPRADPEAFPNQDFTYPHDVYAWGPGTEARPAYQSFAQPNAMQTSEPEISYKFTPNTLQSSTNNKVPEPSFLVAKEVNKLLKRIAPGANFTFANIPTPERFTTVQDMPENAVVAGQQWHNVINTALQFNSAGQLGSDIGVVLHEAIHYLDTNGFFTPEEQAIIEANLPKLAQDASAFTNNMFNSNTSPEWYLGEGAENPYERGARRAEALALAAEQYLTDKAMRESMLARGAPMARIFEKLRKFFSELARTIRRLTGKSRVEDIFDRVASGQVGNRSSKHRGFSSFSRYGPITADIQQASKLVGVPMDEFRKRMNGTEVTDSSGLPKLVFTSAPNWRELGKYTNHPRNPFTGSALFTSSAYGSKIHISDIYPELEELGAKLSLDPENRELISQYSAVLAESMRWNPAVTVSYVNANNMFKFTGRVPDFLISAFPDLARYRSLDNLLKDRDANPSLFEAIATEIQKQGYNGITYNIEGDPHYSLFNYDMLPALHYNANNLPTSLRAEVSGALNAVRAWHGTPAIFNRFSLQHVLSGEGTIAFGWGLYFAGREAIAKVYKDNVTNPKFAKIQGHPFNPRNPVHRAVMHVHNNDPERALEELEMAADRAFDRGNEELGNKLEWMISRFKNQQYPTYEQEGNMYEVTLQVEDEQLLAWDTLVQDHPPEIRDALGGVTSQLGIDIPANYSGEMVYKTLIKHFLSKAGETWNNFSARKEAARKATDVLFKAGIPGLRYSDTLDLEMPGEPADNYVIFDESVIEIVSMNGQPVTPPERKQVIDQHNPNFNDQIAMHTLTRTTPGGPNVTPPPGPPPRVPGLPPPPRDPQRELQVWWGDATGKIGRLLSSARHLATSYAPFARVYLQVQKIKGLRTFIQADAIRQLENYDLIADKTNIHAALELQRHRASAKRREKRAPGEPGVVAYDEYGGPRATRQRTTEGAEFTYDTDGNVVFVNDLKDLGLSKKGDVIRLTDAEFKGYFAYRNTMKSLFTRVKIGVIRSSGTFKVPIGWAPGGGVLYSKFRLPDNSTSITIREQATQARRVANSLRERARREPEIAAIRADLINLALRLRRLTTKVRGMEENINTPYVPFMRFGSGILKVVDPATQKTVHLEGIEGIETRIGFDLNRAKVNARIKELQAQYPGMDVQANSNTRDAAMQRVKVDPEAFDTLLGLLNTQDLEQYKELRDTVDAILKDRGFNAHLNNADLVPGYSTEFDRSTQRYINLLSSAIAKLHYGHDVYDMVNQMPGGGKNDIADPEIGPSGVAMKEFARKYADYIASPEEELAWARQAAFVATLGLAFDSALLQAASIPQFIWPSLVPHVGVVEGSKIVAKAMTDAARIMKNYYKFMFRGGKHGMARELFGKQFVDMSDPSIVGFLYGGKNLSEAEKRKRADEVSALLNAYSSGTLKALLTLDALGITSESRTKTLAGRTGKVLHGTAEVAGHFFNVIETFSRITAFLSFYRAMRDNPGVYDSLKTTYDTQNKLFNVQVDEATVRDSSVLPTPNNAPLVSGPRAFNTMRAMETAKFMVEETTGVYGKENTPQYMRSGLMKLLAMFQMFVQQMAELQLRQAKTLFEKGATSQAKKVAAGTLLWINIALFTGAGLLGNIAANNIKDLIELIASIATREGVDIDRTIREFGTDILGSPIAGEMLLKGPASYLSGIDVTNRLSLGDVPILNIIGSIFSDSARPGEAFGVPGSMLIGSTRRMVDEISYGVPPAEAIAKNIPFRAGANVVQSYFWATEGVYTAQRNRVLGPPGSTEDRARVNYWDVAAKFLGFTSKNVALEREMFYTQMRKARSLDEKTRYYREQIIDSLTKSITYGRGGDKEASEAYRELAREAMQDVREYNAESPPDKRILIDMTSLRAEVINNLYPERRAIREAPRQLRRTVRDLERLYPVRRGD